MTIFAELSGRPKARGIVLAGTMFVNTELQHQFSASTEEEARQSPRHNISPMEASLTSGFCSSMQDSRGCSTQLCLCENHPYFAQVQGQMATGGRPWCDFILFTTKGISVQRIPLNRDYWEKPLLPKLIDFYDNCLGPEIASPVHVLGLPIRNLTCNK